MPNKSYVNGRAFEYRVKKKLEDKGWLCFRTAGSHSVCDLIAIDKERVHIYFLQLKHRHVSGNERERLYESLAKAVSSGTGSFNYIVDIISDDNVKEL